MEKQRRGVNQSDLKRIVKIVSRTVGMQLDIPPTSFFLDQTEIMARRLLGTYLVRINKRDKDFEIVGGKIVEAEAYLDKNDPASHAATTEITDRNKIFYETGGVSYVFHARNIYYCFNVIVRPKNFAGCAYLLEH